MSAAARAYWRWKYDPERDEPDEPPRLCPAGCDRGLRTLSDGRLCPCSECEGTGVDLGLPDPDR